MKPITYIHVADLPIRPQRGEVVEGREFRASGTTYGRFLFTPREPMMYIDEDNVTIKDCDFIGDDETTLTKLENC